MDPMLGSQTIYTNEQPYPLSIPSTITELSQRIHNAKSSHLTSTPVRASTGNSQTTFLHNRLKHVVLSLGNISFTLDDFLSNPAIRKKVFSEIQKIIAESIYSLAQDILDDIRNSREKLTIENVGEIAKQGNLVLKVIKDVNKIKDVDTKAISDIQSICSFTGDLGLLFSKVSNVYAKWKNKEVIFDFKDLKKYYSFYDFVNISYDAFSSVKDTVGLLDDNMFVKMIYCAAGYGQEFTPFAADFVASISIANSFLAPVRMYLKGYKLYEAGREWINMDVRSIDVDSSDYKKLVILRKKMFENSLDMTRESIKTGVEILILTGIVASNPLTTLVAILSLTSLSIKIYDRYHKIEELPDEEQPTSNTLAAG